MYFQPDTEALCAVAELESAGQRGYFTREDTFAQAALTSCSGGALK